MPQQPSTAATLQALRSALAPVIAHRVEVARQLHTTLRPLIDYAQRHPEALEQWRREREAEAQFGSCHCLCGVHRAQAEGVCTTVADQKVRFDSPTVGPTDVPMCSPCRAAHEARRGVPA